MYNWPTPHGADFKNEFLKKINQKNPLPKYQIWNDFKTEFLIISRRKNSCPTTTSKDVSQYLHQPYLQRCDDRLS